MKPTDQHKALANSLNDCIDWPTRFFDEDYAASLIAQSEALAVQKVEAELKRYRENAPLCEQHPVTAGVRSGCLICAIQKLSGALSRIDYLCGEPNEYELSGYDCHCNEDAVVEEVRKLKARSTP